MGRVPGSHHGAGAQVRTSPGSRCLVLLCLWFVLARSCDRPRCCSERITDFIHSSQISTWPRKHRAKQITVINHLDWLSHFLQAAKALININCRGFLTLLERFSRFLVEQKLTGTQSRCWSNGEGHRDLSHSQVCTNHPETRGVQEGDERE